MALHLAIPNVKYQAMPCHARLSASVISRYACDDNDVRENCWMKIILLSVCGCCARTGRWTNRRINTNFYSNSNGNYVFIFVHYACTYLGDGKFRKQESNNMLCKRREMTSYSMIMLFRFSDNNCTIVCYVRNVRIKIFHKIILCKWVN